MSEPDTSIRVLLVTGMSGAGKSTMLKSLEDLGYEAIDNLPLSFVERLVDPDAVSTGDKSAVALGIDFRSREFDAVSFIQTIEAISARSGIAVSVVFLDCDDDVLARRFTETRRRHPLDDDRPVSDCIRLERQLLQPLIAQSGEVIDTTEMSVPELHRLAGERFRLAASRPMVLTVVSFSYRLGLPREADLVFDVRFLSNPFYDETLGPLSGKDAPVGEFIRGDPACQPFLDRLTGMIASLLPLYGRMGKSYLTVAIGCTGGRHRSVFVAESLSEWLRGTDREVILRHRDLNKA